MKVYASQDYVDKSIPSVVSKFENDIGYLTEHQDLSNYYTKEEANSLHNDLNEYIDIGIANIVNSAPETLDTLGELAAALQENEDVVAVLNEAITTRVKTVNGVGVDDNGNVEVREVPEVTETDNGKFLVVANGVWVAMSIPNAEEVSF